MARANRHSGHNEIQNSRQRYSLIDHESVMDLLEIKNMDELKRSYREWTEGKFLRVILLPDGETVHNAFFDRSFRGESK